MPTGTKKTLYRNPAAAVVLAIAICLLLIWGAASLAGAIMALFKVVVIAGLILGGIFLFITLIIGDKNKRQPPR